MGLLKHAQKIRNRNRLKNIKNFLKNTSAFIKKSILFITTTIVIIISLLIFYTDLVTREVVSKDNYVRLVHYIERMIDEK